MKIAYFVQFLQIKLYNSLKNETFKTNVIPLK